MARYKQQPAFRMPDVDTGEARMYGDLANKLHNYSNRLYGIHEQQRIVQAEQEAAKADPRKGELKNNFTVYGRAYNEKLIKANQAAIKSDYSLKLEQFANEHPDNPAAFSEKANAVKEDVLANALPEVRQMAEIGYDHIAESYLNQIKSNHKKITEAAAEKEIQSAIERSIADIGMLTRNGDDLSAEAEMAGLQQTLMLSDLTSEQQEAILVKARRTMFEQAELDRLDNLPPGDALKQIEELYQEVPEGYSPEDWDKFVHQAQISVGRRATRLAEGKKVLTKEQVKAVSDLEVAIDTGVGDIEEHRQKVEAYFDNDLISGPKRTELLTALAKRGLESIKEVGTFEAITERLQGDMTIIPGSDFTDKDLDNYYGQFLRELSPAQKTFAVQRIGRIPKTLKNEVINGLNSGDPQMTFEAADIIDRLDGTRGLVDTFSDDEIVLAKRVMDFQYLEPEEAVKKAMQITDPQYEAVREHMKKKISETPRAERYTNYNDTVLDHFDDVNEVTGAQLTRDYQRMYEGLLIAGMTPDDAKERTLKRMDALWDKSELTGRWMKYPLELYYETGAVKQAKTRLINDVKNYVVEKGIEGEFTEDDIILTSDDRTAREASTRMPSYQLWLNTPHGIELMADRWVPPFTQLNNYGATIAAKKKREAEIKRQELKAQKELQERMKIAPEQKIMPDFEGGGAL